MVAAILMQGESVVLVHGISWRHLNGGRVQAQLGLDQIQHTLRIRAHAIQLVDERNARHIVAAHLPVDGDGLSERGRMIEQMRAVH